MIVVDTNTIAYLYLPSDHAEAIARVLVKDAHWIAPMLWRSEFRNILAVYMNRDFLTLSEALDIQQRAEYLLDGNEYAVDSHSVLRLAQESTCSAYDCEFVCLAQSTHSKLVTADKNPLRAFPDLAVKAYDLQ